MAFNATQVTNDCFLITPSTNAATKFYAYSFFVGGTNGQTKNINVVTGTGKSVLFTGVPTGTTVRQIITGVRTTNTTATSIVGFGPT